MAKMLQSQVTDPPMAPRGKGSRNQTNKTTVMKALMQQVITK